MAESNRTSMRLQWRLHKMLWNSTGGRLGRRILGMPVVEVVAIGRTSGQERQILISYVEDEGAPAIIGTNAGKDSDPAWAHNLRAQPEVRARWDGRWHRVRATELDGDAWDRVWAAGIAANPGYADYARDLTRQVPIFRLDPQI